jgi:hypothetical protein
VAGTGEEVSAANAAIEAEPLDMSHVATMPTVPRTARLRNPLRPGAQWSPVWIGPMGVVIIPSLP